MSFISEFKVDSLLMSKTYNLVAVYLLNRNEYKEPEKDKETLCGDNLQFALFNPRFLAFVLMALNAVK